MIIPLNFEKLKILCDNIQYCYQENFIVLYIMHCMCFLFLQTWCIPGTVFLNLFAGATFGIGKGAFLCLIVI